MSLFITPSQALRIEQAAKKAWAAYLKQEKATVKEIIGYYQAAHKEIATELVLGKGIEFDRERLQALDRFILNRIEEITPPVKSRVSQSLTYAYQAKYENTLEQISIARNIAIPQIGIHWQLFTPSGIEAYSQFALQLCDQYNLELVNKIQQQLRLGFFERKSWTEIMRDVAEKAFGFKRPGSIPRKPKGVLYKIHRIVRTEMQRMRTFAMQEGLEADQDIIGVHIQFGGGPCPGDVCPPKQGDYYKDGSDMGWPPPSIPFHPNCYDKETKVCTDSGWKLFSELKADDRIYSLNPETFNVGFLPYKQKVSYQYNGKMIHYTGCDVMGYFFDLMVTPDHMQLIKRKRQGAWWELVPDRELSENVNFMFMGEHMATEAIDLRRAEIDYNDYVYDVELPKWHVLLVKRNGVPVWSGNCTCYDWYLYPKLS